VLGQNVSFDKMMVPFAGRSKHTLKMKNKLVSCNRHTLGPKVYATAERTSLCYGRRLGTYVAKSAEGI
jgi:hypothetical protein